MRILAFTDIHANKRALAELKRRVANVDIVLCAGDISVFGMELIDVLEEINNWNKPVYLIHGNHEDEDLFVNIHEQFPNILFVHGKEHTHDEFTIIGWGGGGFSHEDPALMKYSKRLKPKPNQIMLFHGPPHGTAVDWMESWNEHRGCITKRAVIERLQPLLVIVGHLHENFGKHDKIGKSIIINPGPLGKVITIQKNAVQAKKR